MILIVLIATIGQDPAAKDARDDSLNAVIHKIKDVEEIKLTSEQQAKYAEIKNEHDAKLQEFEDRKTAVLNEGQRKKRESFKPSEDRKQSVQRQFEAFLGFTREQREKVRAITKERGAYLNAVRKEVVELLTPEQIEELRKLRAEKRAKRAKKQANKSHADAGAKSTAKHPQWKYVAEGTAVTLQGRTWNTRKASAVEDTKDYAVIGQRNGTATLLGEKLVDRGRVEWEAYYETGALEVGGGGKHFHEVMSFVGDRAGKFRETIRNSGWRSRIEIASLADRPRCIVWNYGRDFTGQASTILKLGSPPKENQWVKWSLAWDYEAETGKLEFQVTQNGEQFAGAAQLEKHSEGPGRFFLHGHVETKSGQGRVRFRNFKVVSP